MVNEIELLPEKPKGLRSFDPTRFFPDWNKQGRRTRLKVANDTFTDVETALYNKGFARACITLAVDDARKVRLSCKVSPSSSSSSWSSSPSLSPALSSSRVFTNSTLLINLIQGLRLLWAAPPGTPMEKFLKDHETEIEEAMNASQMQINSAVRISEADHLSLPQKLDKMRAEFGAEAPSREETELDIEILRKGAATDCVKDVPTPPFPVYLLNIGESQLYLQDLMDFIVKNVLKVKMTSFRKWPQVQEGGVKIEATNFPLWDSEVESVLPRQSYYGRNKSCGLGGLGERLNLAVAKLLINLGKDPNR